MRIMIVEDELALARGLAQMINRIKPDCEVIGMYKNGVLGLQACRAQQPDVTIVDINMPVMSGLELISAAKKDCIETQFVILTGYATFEYAQTALQLGVKEYLLKPISAAALEKVLLECNSRLKRCLQQKQGRYIFDCIVKGKAGDVGQNPLHGWNCVFLIAHLGAVESPPAHIDWFSVDAAGETQRHAGIPEIEVPEGVTLFPTGIIHRDMIVYAAVGQLQDEAFELLGQRLLEAYQKENRCANLTISRMVTDGYRMLETLQETYQAGWYIHKFGVSGVCHMSNSMLKLIHVTPSIRKICAAFTDSMCAGEDSAQMSRTLCIEWRQMQPTLAQLNMDLQFVFGQLSNTCKREISYPNTERIIMDCCTFEALEQRLCAEINAFCELTEQAADSYKVRLAGEVKSWLDQNYTGAFTYKVFPTVFGYHEKYISSLFKETYGITPNRYVEELRLDMAKKLMKESPEALLSDIAAKVGFSDQFYFSKVFKKREHMAPKEYANRYRR